MIRVLVTAFLWLLALMPAARAVEAGTSPWEINDQGRFRLISAVNAVGESGTVQLGLAFQLKPGWKIYWRSPGDAGFPPSIDWKGSDNLAEAVISWPAPHRFTVSNLETMGYKDEVVLPIVVRLNEANQPLSLKASVDYLTCDVLCVPRHGELALDLPAGPAEASPQAHLISRYLAQVPADGARQGLVLNSAEATESGGLRVVVSATPALAHPDLFVERADQMQFGRPKVRLEQGGRRAVFELMPVTGTGEGELVDKPITLTLVDGLRSMEADTAVTPAEKGPHLGKLFSMMFVALLGGFILNLMPCVLPVLSLKVLGLIGHGGAERQAIRAGFLASAAGIVTSFLLLAVVTSALKAAGAAVGWGVQFQQPLFLVLMVAVVTLFAANLFGFYEIPLPQWAAELGRGRGNPHSLAGHFATGAFATLLATPCSAPFLGTALGFALAHGSFEILVIFLLLGLGMALPYLAVAFWPQLAQRLPRPGQWMITARRLLGLVMVGTALWLLFVFFAEAGLQSALQVGGLMSLLLVVLAMGQRIIPIVRLGIILVLVLASVATSSGPVSHGPANAPLGLKAMWKPFDREVLGKYLADGKVVLVDVTAEWCITCQVNKAAVIYRGQVAARLASGQVIGMQADWTRPDDSIAAYLASFGRYGIPFNAVYGPGAPDGLPLAELLSEEAVLDAFEKARKPL
ncbi:MAG TPA: disulfide bond formation protein DsbD [Rhodospirillaceae bacterium]|nr:disulfide bond formation protein DsbD [Rhodospirillaceae bacterium]